MYSHPLRLGFIGGGIDSAVGDTHRIACQMDRRWHIKAGCFSMNKDVNAETGGLCGLEKEGLYGDWRELLQTEKGRLDAIVVLTPTPVHAEIVVKAIQEGYAVICEKALAKNSQEAVRIRLEVEKNNAFLAVTYNYTGYPMLRELRALVKTGRIGTVNQVHIEMPQEAYVRINKEGIPNTPQKWRLQDDEIPTISLDLGVHLHSIVHFLTEGKPLEVVSLQETFGAFNVTDNVMCIARYSKNMSCHMWYSKSAIGHRNGLRVRVYGESGSAEWYQMEPEVLQLFEKNGNRTILDRTSPEFTLSHLKRYNRFKAGHPAGFIEAFANLYHDFADSLTEYLEKRTFSSEWVFGAEIAEEGLKMLEAISLSSKNRCWQKVQ